MSEVPVAQIHKLRDRLSVAVDEGDWDKAAKLARKIVKKIPLALDPQKCMTGEPLGKPHLDGVYTIGSMRYERGPSHAVRAIRQMNRIIRSAQKTLDK